MSACACKAFSRGLSSAAFFFAVIVRKHGALFDSTALTSACMPAELIEELRTSSTSRLFVAPSVIMEAISLAPTSPKSLLPTMNFFNDAKVTAVIAATTATKPLDVTLLLCIDIT
eukprot:CAMPEP_0181216184 /NCGR_PEP_ID=MMETSP1096-20121128/26434_1 /TAXON_ID=156174 ORGANISM="Chrysochromulina ericina, Strain CCMP281" /NCGR_SAMPLE_ID=MMETSP1096 /ASSEMBLY_ACC=CAM_ASM_000453 /LENGTH=114 /DNA_ID=CAMNT_0023308135 /DNA_START=211 /DNA_END=555 /DNA_ORIENTATION=+